MSSRKRRILTACTLVALTLAAPHVAHAAQAGGGNLPWDTPLQNLRNDLTGPFAYTLAVLGVVGAGGALIWGRGHELDGFIKAILWIVLVASCLVSVNGLLTALGISGAMVA